MRSKTKKTEQGSGVNVTLVMTTSLFLILLTFFILLNSIAVVDERRKILAIGSLLGAFGSFSGGLSPLKTGESILPPSAPLLDGKLELQQLLALMEKEMAGEIKIESREKKEVITLTEKALFGEEGAELTASSRKLLKRLSDTIKKGSYPVDIEGFTDNRPAEEKGFKSNWDVSALMAVKVLRYLVEEGVSPERVSAYGFGSNRPVTSNDTRASRARNRRVQIILNYDAPEYIERIYKKRPPGVLTYKKFDFRIFE